MNHSSFSRLAAQIFVSSISICLAASAFAQNDNPTGKSGVFNGNSDIGASFDPYTANTTRAIDDLSVPGAAGSYPLQWIRTMNSRRTEGHGFDFGSAGAWQHSYAWGIDIESRPRAERFVPVPKSYIVYYPDGRRVDFQRRQSAPVDNAWRGPTGTTDRFQPVAGTGTCILLLSDGGQVEFSQVGTFDEVVGWEFELSGPTRIIDPHGQATTFSYTNGILSQITEPAGRWLRISYTNPFGSQVIGGVQAGYGSNTVTQNVSYSYQLYTAGGFNYTTLTGATYSDGTSAAYTYQSSNTYPNTGPPLIQTCDDVRHPGPMKKIAYDFISEPNENVGGIYGEFGIASKWLYPAPAVVSYWLGGHTESRGDGPHRVFSYGPTPLPFALIDANDGCVSQPYLLSGYTDFKGIVNGVAHWTSFCYDANTYLNSVQDRNGNTTTFTRTPLTGKVLTVTHPPDQNGVSSMRQFIYTNPNTAYYLDHVIDELGHRTGYQRDDKFRIKTISYPDSASEEVTYNNFGQVLTHKMTSGGTEGFEYDFRGRLERYRDPYHDPINKTGKPSAWYQYDTLDRVSGVTDWRGSGPGDLNYTTNYEYNQRGQPTKKTHPIDAATAARYFTENTYNNDGTLATQTDERGNTTTYGYDDYKRLSSATAALAFVGDTAPRVTYLYYNRDGSATIDYRITAAAVANVTLPSGKTTKTLYDNNFWKSSVVIGTGAEAATTTYTYDFVGNVKTVKDPNGQSSGAVTTYFYDKRNRQTDIDGPIVTDRNSLGHTITWTYDQIGNKKTQLRANDQLITYDQYDPMNRLQVQSVQHDTAVTDRTVRSYDTAGNLATFTDGRQKRYVHEHDLMNRKTKTIYPPDGGGSIREENYHYDLANNRDTFTDRSGAIQTFQYDNRNRETYFWWNTFPANTMHERWLSYDAASNVVRVRTEADDGSTFIYDGRNRKIRDKQQTPNNRLSWEIIYTFDADSNRESMTYPSGLVLIYTYTSRNQLYTITNGINTTALYQYDLAGNQRKRQSGNGTTTLMTPDLLNRPGVIQHFYGGTPFGRFDYHYDKVDRIDWMKRDSFRGDIYGYYLDDQLKTAAYDAYNPANNSFGATNTTSLVYDANGNRTSQDNATTPDYAYSVNDLNQYNLVNNATPTYDANGNLTSYDGRTYAYTKQNQLSNTVGTSGTMNFYYDGMGRQSLRLHNGAWIYSVWDGWNLLEERDYFSGAVIHSYVHGRATDEMVARFDPGANPNRIWYYQDAQGSTSHLTNDAGNMIERYVYDPALGGAPTVYGGGGVVRASSFYDNRFLYTGRDYYKEGAIYDYRNRFYLPSLGRFLQPDPIGFAGGDANLYRYCGNNPVNSTDPTGTTVEFRGDLGAINTAISYLSGSSTFNYMFSTLVNSPHRYTITTNYSLQNGYFAFGNRSIMWNPGLGSWVTSGQGIQSPAMILAHELAHAFDYDSDPASYQTNRNITVPGYHKMVEYIAVAWETLIARQLGEATRQDHDGAFVPASSATDRNPKLAAYLGSQSTGFVRYFANGMLQFGPGWGTGSGMNPGSWGGASTAAVSSAIFQTKAGIPGGGGQPGEGFHPIPLHLR